MFTDDYLAAAAAAKAKVNFLKNNLWGYVLASMLAGMYVGIGILLIFNCGGLLAGAAATKIVMGAAFGIALSLVIVAGSELFTGNNFVITAGLCCKTVRFGDALKVWGVCLLGNWAGSVVLAAVYKGAGFPTEEIGRFMAAAAAAKMSIPLVSLFLKAVLCNILVCLAVWCSFRLKSETAKLIMVFWCLFAFITCGFEHSVANMTLLSVAMLEPFQANVSWAGYFYNIFVVILGNMVGAIVFLALPYYIIAKKKEA